MDKVIWMMGDGVARTRASSSGRFSCGVLWSRVLLLALCALAAPRAEAQQTLTVTAGPEAGSATYLKVSWTEYTGAEKYRLRWKPASGAYNRYPQYLTRTHTIIAGLAANTTYTVEVTAVDDADTELAQATASGTTLMAMSEPITVSAVSNSRRQLAVSWPAVTGNQGYRVQWKPASDGLYSTTSNSATTAQDATTHTIRQLTAGTVYDVKVTYLTTIGGSTVDGASATGRGATNSTNTPPTSTTWAAKMVRDEFNDNALIVSWTAYPNASLYRIRWKSGNQSYSTSTRTAAVTDENTSYTIHGLTPGVSYTAQVVALGYEGLALNTLATTPDVTRLRLGWLTDLYLDPVDGNSTALKVTWEPVAGAAGYVIDWKPSTEIYYNPSNWLTVTLTGANNRSYTLGGDGGEKLEPDTKYDVRVSVWSSEGSSSNPDGDTFEVSRGTLPSGVTNLSAAANGTTKLDVSWNAATATADPHALSIVGYRVQWKKSTGSTFDEAEVTETSHQITGLTAGSTYNIQVGPKVSYFGETMYGPSTAGTGTTPASGVADATAAAPDEPTITIYHDPNHSTKAVDRYDEAERLLANARRPYLTRIVTGTDEVDRLAGVVRVGHAEVLPRRPGSRGLGALGTGGQQRRPAVAALGAISLKASRRGSGGSSAIHSSCTQSV